MRINTNLIAQNTFTQYTKNNNSIASSVEKLSSGYAINSAADNAAGLAISEKMRAQIRGLDQASSNAQDAISLSQTAEGALSSSTEILQRMREISVQSSSDTNNDDIDRDALQDEFSQLQSELDDISSNTSFNKKNLLDGSIASTTKSISNVDLGNSSLGISVGNADAGDYNFNVSVKQETAAVAGQQADEYSAVLGTDAKNYFSAVGSASGGLAAGETSSVALGSNASQSALLNGNYSLSTTSNDDGSMTVTATGDNGQSFNATITADQLTSLEKNSTGTATALDIKFSADADDAFTLSLGVEDFSNTTNGKDSLSKAIADTTVSVSGGVTAQDATYGVYASLTGGDAVKLNTGDTSVTFGNGVTVSFNELTASDLDTANKGSVTGSLAGNTAFAASTTDATTSGGESITTTNGLTNYTLADSGVVADGAMGTVTSTYASGTTTFSVTDNAGATYTATLNDSDMGTSSVAIDGSGDGSVTFSKNLTFTDSNGTVAFTADYSSVSVLAGYDTNQTASVTYTGATDATGTASGATVANSGHNYSKVFGDGTKDALTNNGDSSFSVTSAANDGLTFQVGANSGDTMTINIDKMDSETLGVNSAKVDTQDAASAAISTVDDAINQVSSQRAYLGAIQNRLDYKISNLDTSSENLTAAESQIRDVDMASEMTKFTNANILSQASTAMLAQANSLPQNVLSLLQ